MSYTSFKRKLILSFFAVLIGWASGFIYFGTYMTYATSQGRPTDVEAILVWTAIFIAVAWILFVLPLIFLVPDASRIFSPLVAPVFGAVYGLVAFLLLVGWWTGFWIERLYLNYSLVVGSATGLAYSSFLYLIKETEAIDRDGAA